MLRRPVRLYPLRRAHPVCPVRSRVAGRNRPEARAPGPGPGRDPAVEPQEVPDAPSAHPAQSAHVPKISTVWATFT